MVSDSQPYTSTHTLSDKHHRPVAMEPATLEEDSACCLCHRMCSPTGIGASDLKETGYAALLVTDPDHFYMLSGFHLDVAPWERPIALAMPAAGEPFLIMNELSTHHLRMARERGTLHMPNYALYVEHPRTSNRTYTRDRWMELLALKLTAGGVRRGRVAVDRPGAFGGSDGTSSGWRRLATPLTSWST